MENEDLTRAQDQRSTIITAGKLALTATASKNLRLHHNISGA